MSSADREDMETARRRSLGWPAGLVAAGLVVMLAAGVRASRYRLAWGERLPRCVPSGDCTEAGAQAALGHLWWAVGSGASVVLLGVVLAAVLLPAGPTASPARTMGPVGHAALAGGAGLIASAVLAVPGSAALALSQQAWATALCGLWIGQAVILAALDQGVGVLPAQAAWLTGLGASGGALLAASGPFLTGQSRYSWDEFVLVDALALTAVVLAVRLGTAWIGGPSGPPARSPGSRPRAAALLFALASAAAVALPAPEQAAQPVAGPAPSHVPAIPTVPAPAPTPTAIPLAPVAASVPCAQQDLRFSVVGFDGAMGARAASLQATNMGPAPCWLEGTPVVVVMQGGRPLSLSVGPGETADGAPAATQRVGLAPGGTALAVLAWRSYGGWADLETPQSVATALDANSSLVSAQVTAAGPAPFDIADGGAWTIAPWAPPGN
jgi:hypothetical protein